MYEAGDHGRGRISFPHSTPPLHPPDFSTFSPQSVYAFPNVGATNDVLEKMLVNKNVWSTAVTRRNTHQSFESWLSKEGKTTNKSRDEEAVVSMVRSVEVTEGVELSMSRCSYGSSAIRASHGVLFVFFWFHVRSCVRNCPHVSAFLCCVRVCPHSVRIMSACVRIIYLSDVTHTELKGILIYVSRT